MDTLVSRFSENLIVSIPLTFIVCVVLVLGIAWLYFYWRHIRLYAHFITVQARLQKIAQACPSFDLDLVQALYQRLVYLLQANNFLRGIVDIRQGRPTSNRKSARDHFPNSEDRNTCIVVHKGLYVFRPKDKAVPTHGITYPGNLLRASLELNDENLKEFQGVTKLAEIIQGRTNFPDHPNQAMQMSLRDIGNSKNAYLKKMPELKAQLIFETRHFLPYGFHEHPPIVGKINAVLRRPLRHRPYITKNHLMARKQLRYWRTCLNMFEGIGAVKDISSVQPDVFLKKRQWKPLAKMPLWETSLSNLIRWLCYERTKQLFWRAVHRALARPEGKSRMALCFPFPIVELQNLICRVPSENLDAKLMVKLSKKLWCCRQIVQRHDGATPTRFRKLRLMLCAMHTKPLRRAFSKATESQNQYSGRHRLKRRSSSHAST